MELINNFTEAQLASLKKQFAQRTNAYFMLNSDKKPRKKKRLFPGKQKTAGNRCLTGKQQKAGINTAAVLLVLRGRLLMAHYTWIQQIMGVILLRMRSLEILI